jgi:hypothetical protein
MFLRPQAKIRGPTLEAAAPAGRAVAPLTARSELPPVVALLGGVPLQNHELLANRLNVDDPHELERLAVVSQRHHGTAMASLILHGDLNGEGGARPSPPRASHPLCGGSRP